MLYVLQKTKELHLKGSQFGHSTVPVNRAVDHAQMRFVNTVSQCFLKSFGTRETRCNSCLTSASRRNDVMKLLCVPCSVPLLYLRCGLFNPHRKALI